MDIRDFRLTEVPADCFKTSLSYHAAALCTVEDTPFPLTIHSTLQIIADGRRDD